MRSPFLIRRALLLTVVMCAAGLAPRPTPAASPGATSGDRPVKTNAPAAVKGDIDLAKLKKGDTVEGFEALALYLDDRDVPVGARFAHKKTGFTVDLLRIESVPQAFTWVRSVPCTVRAWVASVPRLLHHCITATVGGPLLPHSSKAIQCSPGTKTGRPVGGW